tara:strand:- start:130 stop:285 length:156 start_codon:yes stop_codon:yes gene_type:complete
MSPSAGFSETIRAEIVALRSRFSSGERNIAASPSLCGDDGFVEKQGQPEED